MRSEKRWTKQQIMSMDNNEFQIFQLALKARAFGFIGVQVKDFWEIYEDPENGDIVLKTHKVDHESPLEPPNALRMSMTSLLFAMLMVALVSLVFWYVIEHVRAYYL